jgi:ABC-2 type transport system ATP-binding protein
VRETLRIQSGYFGLHHNDAWISELLDELGLADKAGANMRQLSGGMKRRVLVAQALVHRPPVIVLDEPTAGVDVELRQGLWQFIRKLNRDGHTIVLTTHYLEEAEALCGRIAMLKGGRIVALDTTANLLRRFATHSLRARLERPEAGIALGGVAADDGGWIEFGFDSYQHVESLLARLREADAGLIEMQLGEPDLERVFVEVMHRA